MKKIFCLSFMMFLLLSLISCIDTWETVQGQGPVISRKLNLPSFHSMKLSGSGNIILIQAEEQEVIVEGQENILDLLDFRVVNGELKIEFLKNVGHHKTLEFFITIPVMKRMEVSGSACIASANKIVSEHLIFKIIGSGNIDANIEVEKLTAEIAGSGNLRLSGNANNENLNIAGSGDIFAFQLEAHHVNVQISGSGNIEIMAIKSLNVQIAGSGNVYYKGDPQITSSTSGSGKLKNVN